MQKASCDSPEGIIQKILSGDIRTASRLLTAVERRDPCTLPILKVLYPHTGKAKLLGVTGPAGAGKSSLISELITAFRKKKKSLGILAVDPSSPLSGGAILGDRIRMHQHFLDKNVFIRSLATRGAWGGISPSLFDAIHVLDAMGKEIIIVETIGVGQDEVRIAQLAETVLLVLTPDMGDVVQTMKAGLLEIGDVIAVNKSDLLQDDQLIEALREDDLKRPVIKVSAEAGSGLSSLLLHLDAGFKKKNITRLKKARFVQEELQWLLYERLQAQGEGFPFSDHLVRQIALRKKDPYASIERWEKKQGGH